MKIKNIIILAILLLQLACVSAENQTLDISGKGVEYQFIDISCNSTRVCFDVIRQAGGEGAQLARCNMEFGICEMPVATGSGFNLSWQVVVLIGIATIAFVTLVYIQYKHEKPKKRFTNPYIVAMVATLILALLIFVMQAFGMLGKDTIQKNWIIFVMLMLGVYFSVVVYLKIIGPLSFKKLKSKAKQFLRETYNAVPYGGSGSDTPWIAIEYSDTKDDNQMLNKVINFLVLAKSSVIRLYILTLSITDGEIRRSKVKPTNKEIKKLFSKEIAADIDLEKRMYMQAFVEDTQSNKDDQRNDDDR